MEITTFLNVFCDTYDLLLLISVKPFLPSLRVFKDNQERDEIIRIVSITKEI